MQTVRLTIRETAEAICRRFGGRQCPDWKLRRLIDVLESQGVIDIQRIGTYRTVADSDLPKIADELRRIGRLAPNTEAAPC